MKGSAKYVDNSGVVDYKKKVKPMTFKELRQRLKHIEILVCSLSIDLANEIKYRDFLKSENAELKAKLVPFNKHLANREAELAKLPPEERAQREMELAQKRIAMSNTRKKKAMENMDGE